MKRHADLSVPQQPTKIAYHFTQKQNNTQFQYSTQTGLCELKTALSNILYHSTLPVLMHTTDTCGNAIVLQNNVLIPLT